MHCFTAKLPLSSSKQLTHASFLAHLRYALRVACAQPTTNPATAALPPSFPSSVSWRDPATGRHAVPYPMTREWGSTQTRGCPPFHIDSIASLLKPWSKYTLPICNLVGLPRPPSPPSSLTKADCNPKRVFPLPPSGNEVLLFSDGSKTGSKVVSPTSARPHRRAPPQTTVCQLHYQSPHPLPPMAHVCIQCRTIRHQLCTPICRSSLISPQSC